MRSCLFLCWVLVALMVLAGCGGGSSGGGDHVLIAADRNGELYVVDAETGGASIALYTSWDTGDPIYDLGTVSGMVWHPQSSRLLASTGGVTPGCDGCLFEIDVPTGDATFLYDNGWGMTDLAVRPDGKVYATVGECSNMILIDLSVPSAKVANTNTGCSGNGMAFSAAGDLYIADDDQGGSLHLVTVTEGADDLTITWSSTLINYIGFDEGVSIKAINSMTRNPSTGKVLGIVYTTGGSGGGTRYLVSINLGTADVTAIGALPTLLDGLAWVPTAQAPEPIILIRE